MMNTLDSTGDRTHASESAYSSAKVSSYVERRRAFDAALQSSADALAYRRERLESYCTMLEEEVGVSANDAESIDCLIALGRPIDRIVKGQAPDIRAKLHAVLTLPGHAPIGFQRWERDIAKDPEELSEITVRAELAEIIVRELGRLQTPAIRAESDRFLYPLVALLKLREIGGTWEEVAHALRAKVLAMNAGADANELFIAYGKNVRAFAEWYGADLPRVDGKLPPGEVPLPVSSRQLLAIHTLMDAAEKYREAWTGADIDGRQKITSGIDEVVRRLAGSGLSKFPLSLAIEEYVQGKIPREVLERTVAGHRPSIAQRVDKDHSTAGTFVPITV